MTKEDKARLEELLETLSMKQRLFVEAYFKTDYNSAAAVREAGYKCSDENAKKIGWQLLKKPLIKEIFELRAKEKIAAVSINEEFVIRKLIRTINKAEEDNNLSAVLRGLELAARNLGMLRDKTEITGKDGEALKFEKVENDAADFTRSILSIAKRGGARGGTSETTH